CKPPRPTTRELATPTGLALAKAMAASFGELPEGVVRKIGYGLGHAELPWPNVLRAVLMEDVPQADEARKVLQLEANLDDMTSEALAHALDRLMAEGALDAWLTPIHMKKGRPGFTLGVLCKPQEGDRFAQLILRETSTLGVRYASLDRQVLPREARTVETLHGPIRCKVAKLPDGSARVKPEFEDCRRAAEAAALPLSIIEEEARLAAREQL
ncbi:MAG TPA: LarC family nickel insertion protein, partial [Holophaga sp.]|nr:LarC family nickel insertion protein [Holophaga sp.]